MPNLSSQQMPSSSAQMQRVDAQDFAEVLQNSINREVAGEVANNTLQPESVQENTNPPIEKPVEEQTVPKRVPEKPISPNAAKAKALLRSGYSIEDTARETGMGRGAIELLNEMNKHDL
jgi:hypothetical protein